MRVRCDIRNCEHWDKRAGDYIGEGGCTLDEITISDETCTAAGFLPMCMDYKERKENG